MQNIPFIKMQGLGNDFVVLDQRVKKHAFSNKQIRHIANRRRGIGCDQVIMLESTNDADVFMRIYNADSSEVSACGNATRCIAAHIMQETGQNTIHINTLAGTLVCTAAENGNIAVNMGMPKLDWQDIPLAEETNTLNLPIKIEMLENPVAISMGNPHAVFFVPDTNTIPLDRLGPQLEHHPLFPERANIGIAQVLNPDEITLRVWERGVGETDACGTGACAATVAAIRKSLTNRTCTVHLRGGDLRIHWDEATDNVTMTGPAETSFEGVITL